MLCIHFFPPMKVRVYLVEEDGVCSSAFGHQTYQQEVKVGPMSSRSVPFVFVFTKEGLRSVQVTASIKDSVLNDGVKKMIYVVVRKHAA